MAYRKPPWEAALGFPPISLTLFDGEAEGGASPADPLAQGEITPTDSIPTPATPDGDGAGQQEAFERLIKGEYKEAFARRMQQIIDSRFKETKALKAREQAITPLLEGLSQRYGIPLDKPEEMLAALQGEGQSDILKEDALPKEEGPTFRERLGAWHREGAKVKAHYPTFHLMGELLHPMTGRAFHHLLRSGVPMRTAYEVLHHRDILGSAMRYTAEQIHKKTLEGIRTRGMRPQENGARGRAAVTRKTDVASLSPKERRDIERRVQRGEKVSF